MIVLLRIQSRTGNGRRLRNRFLKVHIAYSIQLSLSSIMSSRLQPSGEHLPWGHPEWTHQAPVQYHQPSYPCVVVLSVVLTSNQASTLEASEEAPVSVDWPSTSTAALSYD